MSADGLNNSDRKDLVSQVRGYLMRQDLIDWISEIAPKHLNATRLASVLLATTTRNDTLLQCTRASLVRSLVDSALCGLEIGVMGQAYLVPRWNDKLKANEATMLPGYQGLCLLARQSGTVDDIRAELVYEADEFEFVSGTETWLRHVPNFVAANDDAQGQLILAYMIARLPNGIMHPHVMTRARLNKIKTFALSKIKNQKYVAWILYEEEMQKKTVIRQGLKILANSPNIAPLARAIALHDASEAGIPVPAPSETELSPEAYRQLSNDLDADLYYSTDDIGPDGEMSKATRTEQLKQAQQRRG